MNNLKIELPAGFSSFKKLFKRKKKRAIGVDVGSDSIKIVELAREKGQLVLKNYALVKTNKDLIKEGTAGVISDMTGKTVKNAFKGTEIRGNDINIAVPSFTSLVTTMELEFPANASENEIDQVIQLEAPKFIPVPLSEAVYGWQIIDKDDTIKKYSKQKRNKETKENIKKQVVLVAIMKEISQRYEKVFTDNDFKIDAIEVDIFSLIRTFVGEDKKNYLVLDMGGKVCNIAIVYKGDLVLNRSIDVSGHKMTDSIAEIMNISKERAEQLKIEKGLQTEYRDVREQVLLPLVDTICKESKKALADFKKDYSDSNIENIILTGGSSQLKGLKEYLEKELTLKVLVGNSWSRVTYPKQLEKTLFELSPVFGVAVGLAIFGLEEK
jgi:type IV pilus assembly protein PilM